jgi:hypothetical protein
MRAVWVGAVAVLAASAALALAQQTTGTAWISAGTSAVLPAQAEFPTPTGRVGLFFPRAGRNEGASVLYAFGQKRTRLRDLSISRHTA